MAIEVSQYSSSLSSAAAIALSDDDEKNPVQNANSDHIDDCTMTGVVKSENNHVDKKEESSLVSQNGATSTTKSKNFVGSEVLSLESASPGPKFPSKITYLTMTTQCIRHLSDRSGSSFPAIYKTLRSLFEKPDSPQIKHNLNKAIKQGVKSGRFVKVKNSFKINSAWTKKEKEEKKRKEREKKRQEAKRQKLAKEAREKKMKAKIKVLVDEEKVLNTEHHKVKIEMTEGQRKIALEKEKIKIERIKIQEQKQKEAKLLAEKIRKRKFPMDDLELIKEDKSLHVKPPHPKSPPPLPLLIPEHPQLNYSTFRRGVISDTFQVFHFFRGDVGWRKSETVEFKLNHLFSCCQEIANGNAKHNGTLPPLIVHLFVVALHHLTMESTEYDDLEKLGEVLNSLNWSEILFHYMEFMQDLSISASPAHVFKGSIKNDVINLPPHYYGYLGPPKETLSRAHAKLSKMESSALTVEECMCLLRVLCDDILADSPEIENEINARMEEMHELNKIKKAAETNWRKVKLAYEGPKYPPKKKKETLENEKICMKPIDKEEKSNERGEQTQNEESNPTTENGKGTSKPKPKPTKKEYESAEKAKQKAIDNYDRGLRKLVARTGPLGYDRNHCAVYHFYHDPQNVYLETMPHAKKDGDMTKATNRTWRTISCKSLLDNYIATLDVRGIREAKLENELKYKGYVRRHLYDDIRVQNLIDAKKRKEESLQKKYESAIEACADSNRRSGRLVGMQQLELQKIEEEINVFKALHTDSTEDNETSFDVKASTGYELLKEFEKKNRYKTESKQFRCVSLWAKGHHSGVIGPIILELLELEKSCNSLVPWEKEDETRNEWIETLKLFKSHWENEHILRFGSNEDEQTYNSSEMSQDSSARMCKRRKSKESEAIDLKSVPMTCRLKFLKKALLDLEIRVMKLSGKLISYTDEKYSSTLGEKLDSPGEIECYQHRAWKKRIKTLASTPTCKTSSIRDILISAIAIARKAHLKDVTNELRSSLKLFRPNAGHAAKVSALAVLEKHGGCEMTDEDEMNQEGDDDNSVTDTDNVGDPGSTNMLSDDAVSLFFHLDGDDATDRDNWVESVEACKTMSRFAAFSHAFAIKVKRLLEDIDDDRCALLRAIEFWSKEKDGKKMKNKKGKSVEKPTIETTFWVHSNPTEKFVLAKINNDYPWWPARICQVKDSTTGEKLEGLGRIVVILVGGDQFFVLKKENVKPYAKVFEEDLRKADDDIIYKWRESISMIDRMIPDSKKKSDKRENQDSTSEEEKKSFDS